MVAPKGNEFWKQRSRHGRLPKFESAEMLLEACEDYFQWVSDNPLYESKAFAFEGEVTIGEVPKLRAMTLNGLCLFIDINITTWHSFREKQDFSDIVSRVDKMIYEQKFTGAAAGILNSNIIARDLGLSDKKELTGKDGEALITPLNTSKLSTDTIKELLAARESDDK